MKTHKERVIIASLTLVSALGGFAQTSPPNDNFDNRTVLTGSTVTFGGSLVGATLEGAETNNNFTNVFYWVAQNASGSVWWTWTASASGTVVVTMTGAFSLPIRYAVYTGTDPTHSRW